MKAQVTSLEYPSGYLSEERINKILELSRKDGATETALQKKSEMLHNLLKNQNNIASHNRTNNNPFAQKTYTPPGILTNVGCVNPGFEDGTTNGWTFTQASCNAGQTLPCPNCLDPTQNGTTGSAAGPGGVFEVTSVGGTTTSNSNAGNTAAGDASNSCNCGSCFNAYTAGIDYYGGFPVVAPPPLGGTHSLLLNNANCGYLMQRASYSFVVTAATTQYTFQYAIVLMSSSHPVTEAPYFQVSVMDNTTNAIVPCTSFSATAVTGQPSLATFSISPADPTVYYKPWTTVTQDLSAIVGHTVTVNFDVSDCNGGAHFGYAYIDANCAPLQITRLVALCPGQNAVLSGPPGMATYAWSPGGQTTQNITTSTVGNYTLATTNVNGCPSPLLYYNLTQEPDPVPSFSVSSPPCSGAVTFTDGSTIAAPDTITNWVWNYGDGSPSVNSTTAANQNHTYTVNGTYTVTLTDTTNNKCAATYTFVVSPGGGGPIPSFSSNSPPTAPQCLTGNNVVFTNATTSTGSVTISGYTWDYGDGSPMVTSTTVTPNPPNHTYAAAGTYVVTLTVNVTGCSSTITETVVILPEPTASFTVPPVCLGNPSVFTSTTTNANMYSWTFGDGTGTSTVANPSYTYGTANTFAVSLTVTAVGGCSVTATGNALVSPVPTASFTVAPVCQGTASFFDATASTPAVGGTYNWSFGGAAPNTDVVTVQTDNHTYLAAGTFPVTLVITVGSCSATATGNAVVNPMPILSITTTPACDLSPIIVTNNTPAQATFTTWVWTFGDGIGISAVANPGSYTYPADGIYTITLTATTTTGCSGTVTTTAFVHPNPIPNGTYDQTCLGGLSSIYDLSTITNPPGINDNITSWSWDFGDGFTTTTAVDSANHTYATCGVYPISYTVTTGFGCSASIGASDTVFCIPNVTAPPSFSICPGTPVTSTQTTFTTTCQAPALWFPATIYFVNNPSLSNNTTSTHGGIPLADTVGFNSIPNYSAITPNLSCNLLVDTIYGFAITTDGVNIGCAGNMTTFTISVYPTPILSPMPNDSNCAGLPVTVPNFIACPAASTVNWANTNPAIGLAANGVGNIGTFMGGANVTGADVTSIITASATANGCTGPPINFNLIVNPIPTMVVLSPSAKCPGQMVNPDSITTVPVSGVTFNWINTNTAIGLAANGSVLPVPYPAPTNTTLANVSGVVTFTPTYNGCVGAPASETITIKPTPYMQPIADQYWCPDQNTNAQPLNTFPVSANSTFQWSYNTGGGVPSQGTTNPFPSLPTSNLGITTLVTAVTVTPTLNGCVGPPGNFNLFVYAKPVASFTNTTVCFGQLTGFTNTSQPNSGSNIVTSWAWDMNNDFIFGDAIGPNPNYSLTPAGTHTVNLIVATSPTPALSSGGVGCSDTVSQVVVVNPIPVANFVADTVGCPPLTVTTFTNLSSVAPPDNITSYSWNFGNGKTSTSQSPGPQVYQNSDPTQPYYYNVSLTVISNNGCSNTKKRSPYIEVYPRPVAAFSWGPNNADLNDPTINFSNGAIGYSTYTVTSPPVFGPYGVQYYLGDTYVKNDSLNYVYTNTDFNHMYNDPDLANVVMTYSVTQWVINQYGCRDSIEHNVEINPIFTFYIPNAFTPNADNKNEGFKGTGIGIDNNTYNFWVFDRWGMMIYYSNDIDRAWDGHMRGNEGAPVLQEDVYVWKVKFKDIISHRSHEYHGTVTLIK